MPLFDYLCIDCGKTTEFLMTGSEINPQCGFCGGRNLKKMMSAHSSMSGPSKAGIPGSGDTACCGSVPGMASGCAGPGSCCGKG